MKKSYFPVLLFVIFLNISCVNEEPSIVEDYKLKTSEAKAIVKKNNQFAFDFFKEVSNYETKDNFMVSPVSLSLALGMTYNGSEGETKLAFDRTLNYTSSLIEINQFNKNLIGKLSNSADGSVMEIANSIWIREGLLVKDDFVNLNKDFYSAEVQNLDFSNPVSIKTINRWVSNKTYGKITSIIDKINQQDVMFLINAIYFNANWKYKFESEKTKSTTFYKVKNETIQVKMMNRTENVEHFQNELMSSIVLPYLHDKFSMVILLPKENKSTNDIIAELNSENWNIWLENHTPLKISISLPKFKLSYENKLNEELIGMGLGIAFSDRANFSEISNMSLQISEVLQKTFIDVNEKGTEAAAVTSVGVVTTSLPRLNVFKANKPFIYVIKENVSGSICFVGKVGEPKYEE